MKVEPSPDVCRLEMSDPARIQNGSFERSVK
jgi:hypothetical protein